jgi:hypothetical protein
VAVELDEAMGNPEPINVRPRSPSYNLQSRRPGRNSWAQPTVQEFIHQRNRPGTTLALYDAGRLGKDEGASFVPTDDRTKESLATEQSGTWPYSVGSKHISGKIRHKSPEPHLFSNWTSTTLRYPTNAPNYSYDALAAADRSGKKHPLYGVSLANQRYQYHMMLSQIPLKEKDADLFQTSPGDETEAWTGGAKTDTLMPGSSHSNAVRWAPRPASSLTDLSALEVRRSTTASLRRYSSGSVRRPNNSLIERDEKVPMIVSDYVQMSRDAKEVARQARERRRLYEHAKKHGVKDVESWLESLDQNKNTNRPSKNIGNCWSNRNRHEFISVLSDGITISPSYSGIREYNGLVRAEQEYLSGRHYWEITLERFSVSGLGWHCIGVASTDTPRQGGPGQMLLGSSASAACLCLERCQKASETGRTQEYGKRAVKQGDVVGVLLDLDLGELSFFLNGNDMGVAFYGMKGPLCPAVEMGMMVGQHHLYRANFNTSAPPRRMLEAPPLSDEEAFRKIRAILPMTSKKWGQEGFGAVLSVPSTMPHEAPGGIHRKLSIIPN